jgi:hypothetical protein
VTFSWTAFFVVVAFLLLFIVAYYAKKAGPGPEDE